MNKQIAATISEHNTNQPTARSSDADVGMVVSGTVHSESMTDTIATLMAENACRAVASTPVVTLVTSSGTDSMTIFG